MAEVKTSGLVTAEVLKQALSAQVVLNVVEAQVRQIIGKQIDEEVRVALAGLTGAASGDGDVAVTQDNPAGTENAVTTDSVAATSGTETTQDTGGPTGAEVSSGPQEPAAGTGVSGTETQDGTTNTAGSEAADKPQDNGAAGSEGMAEAQPLP
ncbi:TPA: DUF826 domain-containing protein [Escherichia coli]|nr:DUF826 domain-containing protein [Escherichia coli]HBA9842450.1 DUF826 domain-containing protein [Escherichia coli]